MHLARWAHSKWPFVLLLSLGLVQIWYSRTPQPQGRALYIRTQPSGAQVFKSEPELFLAQDATTSGGTKATLLGVTPGPLNAFAEELPLTLVFRKDGYELTERQFTVDSFGGSNLCPQKIELVATSPLSSLKEGARTFPFLSLMLPLGFLSLLGRHWGRTFASKLGEEQQKIKQGVLGPGTRIGEYELRERVGVGGMAQVFRVSKSGSEESLALKLLDARVDSQNGGDAFLAEVRATAKVTHPGLLFVHDWGEYAGRYYMVTEFLQGQTLKERLEKSPLAGPEVVSLGLQLAEVLEVVHQSKLVHRDVKPSNVFLTDGGRLKLMDFGVAASSGETDRRSGTVGYAPPEQLAGVRVDGRADIYALGVTLLECLLGGPLFEGSSMLKVQEAQRNFKLDQLELEIPAPLREQLSLMLEIEVVDRPASITEVRKVFGGLA